MNRKEKMDKQANLEKDLLINPKQLEEKRKKKIKTNLFAGAVGVVGMVVLFVMSFGIIRAVGKSNLQEKVAEEEIVLSQNVRSEKPKEIENWQEGWIKYKNQIYAYNNEIMTFLFMGIDKGTDVKEVEEGTDGGQADALFLLVLNPKEKNIKVIGINRNTMTDIDIYNDMGSYMTTTKAQIAVQHGFGNGMEESCEYQMKTVKNLFYQIPIHGYCSINMNAIETLTDLVDGIELTAIEDVKSVEGKSSKSSYVVRKGETKQLDGKAAYSYVRYRDMNKMGSADMRLKRQQQFLTEFIKKAKNEFKKNITMPVKLYNAVHAQMVTNVTVDEVAYLATTAISYQFDKNQFYSIKGETVMGEQFEEYYIDETELYEMILDIFYEPVEN